METKVWKKNVLETISHIASRKYQEQSWFGKGKYISSPEEIYCELFDDHMYNEFLETQGTVITATQKYLGAQLKEKMEAFGKKMGETPNPAKVLEDPEWDEIRKIAKKFLDSW